MIISRSSIQLPVTTFFVITRGVSSRGGRNGSRCTCRRCRAGNDGGGSRTSAYLATSLQGAMIARIGWNTECAQSTALLSVLAPFVIHTWHRCMVMVWSLVYPSGLPSRLQLSLFQVPEHALTAASARMCHHNGCNCKLLKMEPISCIKSLFNQQTRNTHTRTHTYKINVQSK